jgi:hypothetical protein
MGFMTKKRIKSLEFHIKTNDYFGTLATILDLLRQDLEEGVKIENSHVSLKKLTDDLLYLQRKYKIVEVDLKRYGH